MTDIRILLEFAARLIARSIHVEFLLVSYLDQSGSGVSLGERSCLSIMRETDQWACVFTLSELRREIGAGREDRRVETRSVTSVACGSPTPASDNFYNPMMEN